MDTNNYSPVRSEGIQRRYSSPMHQMTSKMAPTGTSANEWDMSNNKQRHSTLSSVGTLRPTYITYTGGRKALLPWKDAALRRKVDGAGRSAPTMIAYISSKRKAQVQITQKCNDGAHWAARAK